MAVFITGGHGHIGSWAARFLLEAGEEVILFDTDPVVPDCLQNAAGKVTFIQGSVLDFPHLTDIFRRHGDIIDGILHTVGIMGELVLENPHANVQLNISGTHNMLEVARQFEIPKIVYTSTGAVYGEVSGTIAEDAAPVNPSDLYGATKAACEFLGRQYAQTFGFDFRISRIYFCYGPGKLPSQFIRLYRLAFGALEGLTGLTMDRGSDQRLDFVHVEDAARGTVMLYQAQDPPHRTYNIATGIATSVKRIAELARQNSPFDVPVTLGPGVLMKRCEALDITRAETELGYTPRYDVVAGIRHYAEWMRQRGFLP